MFNVAPLFYSLRNFAVQILDGYKFRKWGVLYCAEILPYTWKHHRQGMSYFYSNQHSLSRALFHPFVWKVLKFAGGKRGVLWILFLNLRISWSTIPTVVEFQAQILWNQIQRQLFTHIIYRHWKLSFKIPLLLWYWYFKTLVRHMSFEVIGI